METYIPLADAHLPFAGVSDFTNPEQARTIVLEALESRPAESRRIIHVGVMTNEIQLHGPEEQQRKGYAQKENIPRIFEACQDLRSAYCCLHFVDYGRGTDKSYYEAIKAGGPCMHALQIDTCAWPDPGAIANAVHTSRRQVEIILQISGDMLDAVDNEPEQLVDKMGDYLNTGVADREHTVTRVLLDRSLGKGRQLDPHYFLPFLDALRDAYPFLGLTVAGGLQESTLEMLLRPILDSHPDVSWDASSRLWGSFDPKSPDYGLCPKKTAAYLQKSLAM